MGDSDFPALTRLWHGTVVWLVHCVGLRPYPRVKCRRSRGPAPARCPNPGCEPEGRAEHLSWLRPTLPGAVTLGQAPLLYVHNHQKTHDVAVSGKGLAGWENPSLGVFGSRSIAAGHGCLWEGVPDPSRGGAPPFHTAGVGQAGVGPCGPVPPRPQDPEPRHLRGAPGELGSLCAAECGWVRGGLGSAGLVTQSFCRHSRPCGIRTS